MKKIFILLLPAIFLFSFRPLAQTSPNCNAAFNFSFLNSTTLKFTPSITGDSPLVRHAWFFGDATPVNHIIAPTHTYTTPGTYSLKHYLSRYTPNGVLVCADTITKQVVIQPACSLTANFAWNIAAGNPLTVGFENLSTPLSSTDSVRWTFGDGYSSLDINAKHTYANPGTYKACLRVKKNSNASGTEPCVREFCKTIVINQPCNFQAYFSWAPMAGSPSTITFQNLSTPISPSDSVRWTFGDGAASLDINAKHTYTNPGTYNACLRVKKNGKEPGSEPCVREYCKTIIINQPCNPEAYFSWAPVAGSPLTIAFQNLSTPIAPTDSVRWTFGDGTASSDINVKHVYNLKGTYKVCLRVKKNGNAPGTPACVKEVCKTITIPLQINCDTIHLNYTHQKDLAVPNKIYFNAVSNASISDQNWTISRVYDAIQPPVKLHQKNPAYVFHDTGFYRVCLRANTLSGCVKEYCNTIRIERLAESCELQAFPNPTHSQINVAVILVQPQLIKAYVYNGMNIMVKDQKQSGNTGNNLVTINMNDLLPGLYTIKLIYGNRTCYARFTKL